jgi:uncharacterized protein YacL
VIKLTIWIIRGLIVIIGPLLGYFQISKDIKGIFLGFIGALVVVIIEYIIEKIPLDTLIAAGIGVVLGYIFEQLFEYGLFSAGKENLNEIVTKYSFLIKFMFIILGLLIAVRKKEEADLLDKDIFKSRVGKFHQQPKIVDTSVIIDGRIADICETKFMSGIIIIPKFILTELQKLADSYDSNKRIRARRGIEILTKLQKHPDITIEIYDKDYPEIKDTDMKLLQLAKEIEGVILTTDFNLNKIASLQGITVLNINDLANALKPIYLPGESMSILIVKEGKEKEQGVGYLDDGTMIVVEEGRKFIGKRLEIVVTSMLQTSAGRMIFAKPK